MGRKFLVVYQPQGQIRGLRIVIAPNERRAISEATVEAIAKSGSDQWTIKDLRAYDLDALPDGWSYFSN